VKWGSRTLSPALTGVHNHSLSSTPFLPYLFFKSLCFEYYRCNCFPACSPISIPEATVGLPLIACWQKVDSREKPPQTLRVSLCGKESAERRTLDTEHQILTDISQGSTQSLESRVNRLRWSRILPTTADHCRPLSTKANHYHLLSKTYYLSRIRFETRLEPMLSQNHQLIPYRLWLDHVTEFTQDRILVPV
jgi:hypothetical protein